MKELLNTFLSSTNERIKNPFLSAFLISFIVFNWKPIFVVLFASQTIQAKISEVEKSYSTNFTNLWLPLLFALFYVIILPYIMLGFDKVSRKAVEERKINVLKQQLFDFKSKKEIAEKESELEDVKASFRDTAELNKKIDILTNQIDERDNIIILLQSELDRALIKHDASLVNINDQKDNSLTDDEEIKLKEEYTLFEKSDLFEHFKSLGAEVRLKGSVPRKMNDIIIEKFIYSGIIEEIRNEENLSVIYKFTKKGMFYWQLFVLKSNVSDKDKNSFPI